MATLVITPATGGKVNIPLTLRGDGFAVSSKVTLSLQKNLERVELIDFLSDAAGSFNTTDEADAAVGTLTASGVAVDTQTVVIDGRTYTTKTTLTPSANEVLIGANAAATLQNLKDAINLTGTPGTQYGAATTIHPTVYAVLVTATTLLVAAKTGGTAGNSLATTETQTNWAWGGGTLAGGAAATGRNQLVFTPDGPGIYKFSATDGTLTAVAQIPVFS